MTRRDPNPDLDFPLMPIGSWTARPNRFLAGCTYSGVLLARIETFLHFVKPAYIYMYTYVHPHSEQVPLVYTSCKVTGSVESNRPADFLVDKLCVGRHLSWEAIAGGTFFSLFLENKKKNFKTFEKNMSINK